MNNIRKTILGFIIVLGIILPASKVQAGQIAVNLLVGEEKQLPDAYWYCEYASSDESIAVVDNDGMVKAKRVGEVVITQKTLNEPKEYHIQVTNEADIVVAMGQSNMCGSGGATLEAPDISKGVHTYLNGTFTTMKKQGTLLPAFGNNYYKTCKRPVIIIQTAVGGASSVAWLRDGLINNSVKQLKNCRKLMNKNHIKIKHIYMLWFQGETDAKKCLSKEEYISNLNRIFKKMKKAGAEKFLMIQVGQYRDRRYDMSIIIDAQKSICRKNKKYVMVSNLTQSLSKNPGYYSDNVHYNQKALNKIGAQAGKKAGKLAKK